MLIKRNPEPQPIGYRSLPVGKTHYALVDPDVYDAQKHFYWRLLKSSHVTYVARRVIIDGKTHTIRLHCLIMNTPPGYECHHKNHNPLDCRRCNLVNLSPVEHRAAHGKI